MDVLPQDTSLVLLWHGQSVASEVPNSNPFLKMKEKLHMELVTAGLIKLLARGNPHEDWILEDSIGISLAFQNPAIVGFRGGQPFAVIDGTGKLRVYEEMRLQGLVRALYRPTSDCDFAMGVAERLLRILRPSGNSTLECKGNVAVAAFDAGVRSDLRDRLEGSGTHADAILASSEYQSLRAELLRGNLASIFSRPLQFSLLPTNRIRIAIEDLLLQRSGTSVSRAVSWTLRLTHEGAEIRQVVLSEEAGDSLFKNWKSSIQAVCRRLAGGCGPSRKLEEMDSPVRAEFAAGAEVWTIRPIVGSVGPCCRQDAETRRQLGSTQWLEAFPRLAATYLNDLTLGWWKSADAIVLQLVVQ